MTDALAKHLLGLQQYGMTDLGEVLEVCAQLEDGTEESWVTGWASFAARLQRRAEQAEAAGKLVTASTAYLRASTYWRASVMYFSDAEDPRMADNSNATALCYERYLKLSGYPGRRVEIPYEDGFLPGHFYTSPVAGENAPVLVITPGRDTWAEDTRWIYDGAIRRGIHALIYDGPGQGLALRQGKLPFRPDWENVLAPVIDFAIAQPGVDPSRVGLFGVSFGGFLTIRAAAFERRAKVCVTDPGTVDWGGSISGRLRMLADLPPDRIPLQMRNLIRDYAWKHGVPNTITDVIEALAPYDNSQFAGRVSCETLVMDGAEEMTPGEARKLYDALNCPKDYLLFDATSAAQTHSQMGSYATATEFLFDWLDERL
ncbi:alpha/beta hydrolase family protein [Streptomyces sp. bgisy027]|uniref:alpha/beta hydrolase family protein n=1 Tax=Streptomyces sp. bgisy027 TaxID=3413770 RepID=UPI003D75C6E2